MVEKSGTDLLYNEKLIGKIIKKIALSDSQTLTTIRNLNDDLSNTKKIIGHAH